MHQPSVCLLAHEALPILLRHPAVLEQQVVACKLLATSKAVSSVVREQCRGQMVVNFLLPNHPDFEQVAMAHNKQRLKCFLSWLDNQAHLLKQLELALIPPVDDQVFKNDRTRIIRTVPDYKGEAEAAIAAALKRATTAAGPLVLQACKLLHGRSSAICILKRLNTTLTSLHLEIGKTNLHLHPRQRLKGVVLPSLRRITPVLEQLTALTSLTIICPQAHKLSSALPALTRLRELAVAYLDMRHIAVLSLLPAALTSLHFNVLEKWEVYYDDKDDSDAELEQQQHCLAASDPSGSSSSAAAAVASDVTEDQQGQVKAPASTLQTALDSRQPSLQLRRLTLLQQLISHTYRLQPDDMFPASLQVLELGYCPCVQPLLQLQQLHKLHMHKGAHLKAADLASVGSKLECLHSMGLAYQDLDSAAEAAAAWSKVPVATLMLDLNAATVHDGLLCKIGQLSCLTRLYLLGESVADSSIAMSPTSFGGILQQLSGLKELQLHSLRVEAAVVAEEPTNNPAAQDTHAAAWRHSTSNVQVGCASRAADSHEMTPFIAAIAALPQLVSLTLSDVGCSSGEWLSSQELAPLAAATQLTCLHVFMSWLDDEGVIELIKSLKGLRRLGLDHCARITDAAAKVIVKELTALKWLSVWGTRVRGRGELARPGLELVGV